MTKLEKEFSEVKSKSFRFQGVTIHPPSAYTDGQAWRSHIGHTASQLGPIYITFLHEFEGYFRYGLFHLRNELFPSAKIAEILLNLKLKELENDQRKYN